MRDRELYQQILGIGRPWSVDKVDLQRETRQVIVKVVRDKRAALECPECGTRGTGYDHRVRRWRHLDTCQYQTILEADIPRVRCKVHGVRQTSVPWAEEGSRFTALFEALVIDWLHESTLTGVAGQLGLSWDEVSGVQERAVRRGLARRKLKPMTRIGVDETSFQRRHEYVTIVIDQEQSKVVHVADGRGKDALEGFYQQLGAENCAAIEHVAMDMWGPYITVTKRYVPEAEKRIAFDKFHVAQHLGNAVDKVRRQENKELQAEGDERLKGTKWSWLKKPSNMSALASWRFSKLRGSCLKVARAWALKEAAMCLWDYTSRGWASRAWKKWYAWAIRCRLEPVKKVARMIARHWDGVITAAISGITNAASEGMNGKIQRLKARAYGYRNRERFRNAIYFHLGGLDLYPDSIRSAHPIP